MNEPGFPHHNHLDPAAQEFFPTSLPPHIYYPYPHYPTPPAAYVNPPSETPAPHQPTPSRTLLLSMVPPSVSESTVRRDLEVFGDVRAVQMERRRQGLVTVHFYDVRDSQTALCAVQHQHMQQQFRLGRHYDAVFNHVIMPPPPPPPPAARGLLSGHVVWAQFVTPVTAGLPDGNNQGTLVIFNLDSRVSASYLREIFEAFGPVKELRETPKKKYQRFVEFYDVRNAATAMSEMNGKEIYGKAIVVDFSRPGGQSSKKCYNNKHHCNSTTSPSNSNHLSRVRISTPRCNLSLERKTSPGGFTPQQRGFYSKGNPSGSGGSRSSSSTGSSSFHESISNLSISGYDNESSSVVRRNKKSGSSVGSKKTCDSGARQKPWKGSGGGRQGKEYDPRFLINEDAIMESDCRDPRTTVMIKNIPNKYSQKLLLNMLDNHCIHCNEQIADDGDDQPLSSYDFVYLPIDFINKCNVGYGFVNMTSPEATLRLYKAFHHQSWEVFNSRKICEVTYARLQGLEALREHFKNSKFPGDAEEYMPVVFTPPRDGRNLTDPMPIVGGSSTESSPCSVENQSDQQPSEGVDNGHINDEVGEGYNNENHEGLEE